MTSQNIEKNTKCALALVVMFALGFASAELLNRLRGSVIHSHAIPQQEQFECNPQLHLELQEYLEMATPDLDKIEIYV